MSPVYYFRPEKLLGAGPTVSARMPSARPGTAVIVLTAPALNVTIFRFHRLVPQRPFWAQQGLGNDLVSVVLKMINLGVLDE